MLADFWLLILVLVGMLALLFGDIAGQLAPAPAGKNFTQRIEAR